MKDKNKVILFDFDGVIVNSCRLSWEINKEWMSDITYGEIQDWAEGNVYDKKLRDESNDDHVFYYFEQYSKRVIQLVPVEGMDRVIKDLDLQGYKLIIVSSADENSIKDFLKKYDLKKYFTEILGKNFNPSKVEKIKIVCEKYKIKPEETLLVTDSVGDIKEAHEAKTKAIGVIWGLHERERLEKNGSDFIAESPNDILEGIKQILGRI
jgi:phosphoglycolate phosphatase